MRARVVFLLLTAATIGGCTTLSPAEIRRNDEIQCRDYGFRPGTEGFAGCLQRIDLDRRADRRARLYNDGPFVRGGIIYGGFYDRW